MREAEDLEALREFLLHHVTSYEELELLLHVAREPDAVWSLGTLAMRLDWPTDDCRITIEALRGRGLVSREEDSGTYRYSPASTALADDVRRLERAHREQRAALALIMNANAVERVRSAALRTFADAFRFGGPKK